MNCKLYIGNLASGISEEELRQLFSRIGPVADVSLVLDPATGASRGAAFVTMATSELAAAAINDLHSHNLAGRYITVTEARPPEQPKGMMKEGFDFNSKPFRPAGQAASNRRRSKPRSPGKWRRSGNR